MLSKNKIKYIHSLDMKKHRREEGVFLAEGGKLVGDLLGKFPCRLIIGTEEWLGNHPKVHAIETIEVNQEELSRASLLKSPQEVLAIFEQPHYDLLPEVTAQALCLALDDIQDPGNLGTIVRIADWFGINDIFCSVGTVDIYNPKAIQATMGAIARVRLHYCNLAGFIASSVKEGIPVFGTFLNGNNIYTETLSATGLIVMGNEGNGISKEIATHINKRLLIPSFPQGSIGSESLNVSVATAVICAEFRRRLL